MLRGRRSVAAFNAILDAARQRGDLIDAGQNAAFPLMHRFRAAMGRAITLYEVNGARTYAFNLTDVNDDA